MINWEYENKVLNSLEDFPENTFGFVYEILFSNNKKYLGSKYLYYEKKIQVDKRQKKIIKVESNWKNYYGSIKCEDFKRDFKEKKITIKSRNILKLCNSKKNLTYYETKFLFIKECIENDSYYNGNILGKFYNRDV